MLKLVSYPNKLLATKCLPVTQFDAELDATLDEMTKIMLANNGIGLAANQVGLTQRIIIIKTAKGTVYEMINPRILDFQDGEVSMREGCLSAASIYLDIVRPASILLEYEDRTGAQKRVIAEGLEARCIQHEIDHLNGRFYFDLVNRKTRKIAISKLKGVK